MRRQGIKLHKFILRGARRRRDLLYPSLQALPLETPPEGLLEKIERDLEGRRPLARPDRPWRYGIFHLAPVVALAIVLLVAYSLWSGPTILFDPAGRAVAHLKVQNGSAKARLIVEEVNPHAEKVWHLWGLAMAGEAPVHIGALSSSDLVVAQFHDLAGLAISLEPLEFRGDTPTGPVLKLFYSR